MTTSDVPAPLEFAPAVFHEDEVRGRVGVEIDHRFAHAFGQAVGSRAMQSQCRAVVVGRDARLSSVELAAALQAGIRATGMDVIDIGMAATPMAWFAARLTETGAAVSVTGGHDDEGYNGFKVMLNGVVLGGPALRALLERAPPRRGGRHGTAGTRAQIDAARCYASRLAGDVHLARTMKVALDCGNGVAGMAAAEVLGEVGCELIERPEEAMGRADNGGYHGEPNRLLALAAYLRYADCELGLWLDGDGDRIGVVSRSGVVIGADRLTLLLARDMLRHRAGARIIHDVGSSRNLSREIRERGGTPLMCRSGEVRIAGRMRESGALLSGELNGRIRFRDRWYGHSDGLYAAARLLEILSRSEDASATLDALPQACATPELRLEMKEGEPDRLIEAVRAQAAFRGARDVIHVEGLRVEYDDGFGLVRPSHSGSALVLRFEGDNGMALSRIQEDFRRQLLSASPELQLPF